MHGREKSCVIFTQQNERSDGIVKFCKNDIKSVFGHRVFKNFVFFLNKNNYIFILFWYAD